MNTHTALKKRPLKNKLRLFYEHLILLLALGVLSALSMTSCGKNVQNAVTIVSDIPGTVYAIEMYTKQFPKRQLRSVQFTTLLDLTNADIALLSESTVNSISFSLGNFLRSKSKYSPQLNDATQALQVLSFSLPLLVVKRTALENEPDFNRVTLSELQTFTRNTTELTREQPVFGFVPDLEKKFSRMFTSDKAYQTWIKNTYPDYENFNMLYHSSFDPVPFIAQVRNDNIVYKLVASNDFFELSHSIQKEFYYFFLTRDNEQIPVMESSYIGENKNSRNKKGIQDFIDWIYGVETQIAILKELQRIFPDANAHHFFGNTFSSNWDTNMLIFQEDFWFWNNQPALQQIVF